MTNQLLLGINHFEPSAMPIRKIALDELNRLSVDAFKDAPKFSYCLILDNIRSLNNVGSVFRTADAFRAEKLYLCGITGTPPHRDITKTALGATESVSWEYASDVLTLTEQLRAEGWLIAAVEQAEGSVSLADFSPELNKKYAFVLGNEVTGVHDELVNRADLVLEIPQFGTKHSLNIAVTAGIICWDFLQKSNKNLT
jgi:tRNA G18 (ribose-2'-O)-methylase SpoU